MPTLFCDGNDESVYVIAGDADIRNGIRFGNGDLRDGIDGGGNVIDLVFGLRVAFARDVGEGCFAGLGIIGGAEKGNVFLQAKTVFGNAMFRPEYR